MSRLALRRAERSLESVSDRIAVDVLDHLPRSFSDLTEQQQSQIVLTAADVIQSAHIDHALVEQFGRDPLLLSRHVLEQSALPGDLHRVQLESKEAQELLARLVFELCRYIVEVGTRLPEATADSADVAGRRQDLGSVADEVIAEVRSIEGASERAGGQSRRTLEIDYRRLLAGKLDVLRSLESDADGAHRSAVRLIDVFVPLELRDLSTDTNVTPLELRDLSTDTSVTPEDGLSRHAQSGAIETFAARTHRLLVSGEAGSGKSTLLQWLALRAATRRFSGDAAPLNETVPFLLSFRRLAETRLPPVDELARLLVSHASPALAKTEPIDWAEDQLRSGRALILLDGLDEVAARGQRANEWLTKIIDTYPSVRVIVTQQPPPREHTLAVRGFTRLQILPLTSEGLDQLVTRWYDAYAFPYRHDSEEDDGGPKASADLIRLLRRSSNLYSLATRPLFCTILCYVHQRQRKLPTREVQLYDTIADVLLHGTDSRHYLPSPDLMLSVAIQRRLLSDFALWLLKHDATDVSVGQTDEYFQTEFGELRDTQSPAQFGAIVRQTLVRAGVLVETWAERISFVHRSFQEYFAAQALLRQGDVQSVLGKVERASWRNVVRYAAAQGRPSEASTIVRRLLARGDRSGSSQRQFYLLAAACSDAMVHLDPDLRDLIEQRVSELFDERDTGHITDLAEAGDFAVPVLLKTGASCEVASACIRALAEIGSDAALIGLSAYAPDVRVPVRLELGLAWRWFDPQRFAKTVLQNSVDEDGRLDLYAAPTLDGLEVLENVRTLSLVNSINISDVATLARMPSLSELSLIGLPRLVDLSALANMKNLTRLTIHRCDDLTDVSAVASLRNLIALEIVDCPGVRDYEPIERLPLLRSLTILPEP